MKINRFARGRNQKRSCLAVLGILAMLVGLFPDSVLAAPPALAQEIVPEPGGPLTVTITPLNNGAGGQSDPRLSSHWASYTDGNDIRFQNLDLGFDSDRLVPRASNVYDSRSDISGNTIAFTRMTLDSQGIHSQGIYEVPIDPSGNPGTPVEVSPLTSALPLRTYVAIGGDTIAYEDRTYGGSTVTPPEISLSSASDPAAPAYRLTDDTLTDELPSVSPDGDVVVWRKCADAYTCDVWRVERTAGAWDAPEQVTGAAGNEWSPDTNGPVTVYSSSAGSDVNIRWSVKDASDTYAEYVLVLPGIQENPAIAGHFIVFESRAAPGTMIDLWLYDLETNLLYQLTDTPASESLTDVATGPGGLVRVAWWEVGNSTDAYVLSVVLSAEDTTPPVITPTVTGTIGANGWYTGNVSLSWSVADSESAVSSSSGCEAVSITQDQVATNYTCNATSAGGTASQTVSIARDATAPIITCPNPILIPDSGDQTVTAGVDAALSGLDQAASVLNGTVPTGSGWPQTLTFTALDLAGNTATKECTFIATYSFTGFFEPVDNPGSGPRYVFNSVKAGSAVPVKFSLAGDQGLSIFAPGSPTSMPVKCATAARTDPIEQTVLAGNSSLSYDALSDTYTYVWKTNKGWAGTCRVLTVQLNDGTQYLAYFRLK